MCFQQRAPQSKACGSPSAVSTVGLQNRAEAPTPRATLAIPGRDDRVPEGLRVVARLLILWVDESLEGRARSLSAEP